MTQPNYIGGYLARLEYAAQGIMSGEDSRALDTCFEMWDGAFIVAGLIRRAENDEALRAAILRDYSSVKGWETHPWHKTAATLAHVPTHRLPEAARREQQRARERSDASIAQMRGEPVQVQLDMLDLI